jgi:hypothetical protein
MLLSHDITEPLWTVLPRYDLIGHVEFAALRGETGKAANSKARVTTADAEQTTVAAFRPWRGS